MEEYLRGHKRSSSLSAAYTPAPRPSIAPFVFSPEASQSSDPPQRLIKSMDLVRDQTITSQQHLGKRYSGGLLVPSNASGPSSPQQTDFSPQWVQSPSNLSLSVPNDSLPHSSILHERRLWKTLLTHLIAVSVPSSRELDSQSICASLESDLFTANIEPLLDSIRLRLIRLFDFSGRNNDAEEWKQKCQFYGELLEQQSMQIAALKAGKEGKEVGKEVMEQLKLWQLEAQRIREIQKGTEVELDRKLKIMEDERLKFTQEIAVYQDKISQLDAEIAILTHSNRELQDEIQNLEEKRRELEREAGEGKGREEMLGVKVREMEEELRTAVSPYVQLQEVGEQIGKKFSTVADLFEYLASNLHSADPDQRLLLKSYQSLSSQLSGPIAQSPAPTFISAMLSFLLIRKHMLDEERELHGQTLSSLSEQLISTRAELSNKNKEWETANQELVTVRKNLQCVNCEVEIARKRMETAEEEVRVMKKAHERHIVLYQTELDASQKRTTAAEQIALEKSLEAELLVKKVSELQLRIATCEEENEALGHENSFLAFERSELRRDLMGGKGKDASMTASLKELSRTLREIHYALKMQDSQERSLELVIYRLQAQLDAKCEEIEQNREKTEMMMEDLRVRENRNRGGHAESLGTGQSEGKLEERYRRLKEEIGRDGEIRSTYAGLTAVERKISKLDISERPLYTAEPSLDHMSAVLPLTPVSLCTSLLSQVQALSPPPLSDLIDIETLLEPYREGDEPVVSTLARLLQEYEQFNRSHSQVSVAPMSDSIVIHSIERPPARLSLYSGEEDSPADLIIDLLPDLPQL